MSEWTVIERGEWAPAKPLDEGCARVLGDGSLKFRVEDLALVGIVDTAMLLSDEGNLRLAVRRPTEAEVDRAMSVRPVMRKKGRDSGTRQITAARGFKALGLDPKSCVGTLTLLIKDDTILILNLADIGFEKGEKSHVRPVAAGKATAGKGAAK
jgi:hypothetical protein